MKITNHLRIALCSFVFGWLVLVYGFASQTSAQSSPPPGAESERSAQRESLSTEPMEVQTLIAHAMDAPPEFSADALLRIARSSKISSKTRRDLIEYAFSVADKAQHPLQLGARGRTVNGLAGFPTYAYALQLDSLSLRCRAVRAMLQVNKGRAREMFFSISLPELPPLRCQDSLVYDVSAFYGALTAVLNTAFTDEETIRGDGVYLVDRLIDQMVSPVQLAPLARCIATIKTSPTQLRMLVTNLSRRLQQIQSDDRAFSYGINDLVSTGLGGLLNVCKDRRIQTDELVEAFRSYLIRQHRSNRCSDNVKDLLGEHPALPRYVETFNNITRFLGSTERKEIAPLTLKEILPKDVLAVPAPVLFFESPQSRRLAERLQRLGLYLGGKEVTAEGKSNQAWQDKVLEFLNELNDWREDDEPDGLTYFHEKGMCFLNLLLTVPPGALYFRILDSDVGFLAYSSSLTKEDRMARLLYMNELFKAGRALRGEDLTKFRNAIRSSRDKDLLLYAALADFDQLDESETKRSP